MMKIDLINLEADLHKPSKRLNIDIFTSAIDNHQMMAAVYRILKNLKRRFNVSSSWNLNVKTLARARHRIGNLIILME